MGEREDRERRIRTMRDLAWRSRRMARTVPTQWVIDKLNEYATELEAKAAELEQRMPPPDHLDAESPSDQRKSASGLGP